LTVDFYRGLIWSLFYWLPRDGYKQRQHCHLYNATVILFARLYGTSRYTAWVSRLWRASDWALAAQRERDGRSPRSTSGGFL